MNGENMNLVALFTFCLVASISTSALAQKTDFPNKPIHVVVTFPPGGSTDAMMRMLAPRLSEKLGQAILIDNRPGAGGNIGLTQVAKATADGHTVGVGAAGGLTANSSLYPQMPFDTLKDFKPISMMAAIPFVIVAAPNFPAKNLQQLFALAKTQPGQLSMGHGGNGTAMHLSAALLEQMADIRLVQVPYKGSGPAAIDVLAGQIKLAVVDLSAALPHLKAGKLQAFAVTSPQRLPTLPDVPTVSESGLPGYDSTGWFGMVAPTGTPVAVITRLNLEINAALREESIQIAMRNLGMEPAPGTVESFDAYIRSEILKWSRVIRQANIKLE